MVFLKFGLQSVKFLAVLMTVLVLGTGIALVVRSAIVSERFKVNKMELGGEIRAGADSCFFIGITMMVLALFGFLAIGLGGFGIIFVYNILLLICGIVMLVYGLILWMQVKTVGSKLHIRVDTIIKGLDPERLDRVQTNFKCCGIDKFTDFKTLWLLYDMNATGMFKATSTTLKQPTVPRSSGKKRKRLVPGESVDPELMLPDGNRTTDQNLVTPSGEMDSSSTEAGIRPPESGRSAPRGKRRDGRLDDLPKFQRLEKPLVEPMDTRRVHQPKEEYVVKPRIFQMSGLRSNTPPSTTEKNDITPVPKMAILGSLVGGAFSSMKEIVGSVTGVLQKEWSSIWEQLKTPVKEVAGPVISDGDPKKSWVLDWIEYGFGTMVREWVEIFVANVKEWFKWFTSPVTSIFRWWYGSGWDAGIYGNMQAKDGIDILPYSCCKNPSAPCYGDPTDTYMDGCRNIVSWYWMASDLELSILLMCNFVTCILAAHVMYIYNQGIKEKYYF